MAADAIEDDLARRFRIDRPPTLLARNLRKRVLVFRGCGAAVRRMAIR